MRASGKAIESTYNLYQRSSSKLLKNADDAGLDKCRLGDESDASANLATSQSTLTLEVGTSPMRSAARAAFGSTLGKSSSATHLAYSTQFQEQYRRQAQGGTAVQKPCMAWAARKAAHYYNEYVNHDWEAEGQGEECKDQLEGVVLADPRQSRDTLCSSKSLSALAHERATGSTLKRSERAAENATAQSPARLLGGPAERPLGQSNATHARSAQELRPAKSLHALMTARVLAPSTTGTTAG